MDIISLRNHFPQLSETVYNKPLVYLDNAATSLRPKSVIDEWDVISSKFNSNLHRAVHYTAGVATQKYEDSRSFVQHFLNAKSRKEIIFTSGATASLNLIAYSFGEKFIEEGDEIIISEAEHHSNIVPWQLLCHRKKARIIVLPVDQDGIIDLDILDGLFTSHTKLVCICHISNVLGIINPIKEATEICHNHNCPICIDGSQGIAHCLIDVQDIDCDFYSFSGHKIYAAPGTGVLYGKEKWLDEMPPFFGGGEMIDSVSWEHTTYASLPGKFEAGTQNFSSVPTFVPALIMAQNMRNSDLVSYNNQVSNLLLDYFIDDKRIKLFGVPRGTNIKISLFSFIVKGVHHEDLALILDKMGIAVRSGQMCAEPLMNRYKVSGMLRASFAPYNTVEEAEYFIESLNKAINMLEP